MGTSVQKQGRSHIEKRWRAILLLLGVTSGGAPFATWGDEPVLPQNQSQAFWHTQTQKHAGKPVLLALMQAVKHVVDTSVTYSNSGQPLRLSSQCDDPSSSSAPERSNCVFGVQHVLSDAFLALGREIEAEEVRNALSGGSLSISKIPQDLEMLSPSKNSKNSENVQLPEVLRNFQKHFTSVLPQAGGHCKTGKTCFPVAPGTVCAWPPAKEKSGHVFLVLDPAYTPPPAQPSQPAAPPLCVGFDISSDHTSWDKDTSQAKPDASALIQLTSCDSATRLIYDFNEKNRTLKHCFNLNEVTRELAAPAPTPSPTPTPTPRRSPAPLLSARPIAPPTWTSRPEPRAPIPKPLTPSSGQTPSGRRRQR